MTKKLESLKNIKNTGLDLHYKIILVFSLLVIPIFWGVAIWDIYNNIIINRNYSGYDFFIYYEKVIAFLEEPIALYSHEEDILTGWYLYPPLSILFIIPFVFFSPKAAAILFGIISILLYLFTVKLLITILEKSSLKIQKKLKIVIFAFSLAFAPFFQNLMVLQINTFLLFLAILGLYYYKRSKSRIALILILSGFWLKLYTIILAPVILKISELKKVVFAFIIALILMPLIFTFLVPLSMYEYYFLEHLPSLMKHPHSISTINQSFSNFLQHIFLSEDYFAGWESIHIESKVKITNLVIGGILIFVNYYFAFFRNKRVESYFSLMILMLFVAPIAWEATWVLSLPALIYCIVNLKYVNKKSIKLLLLICILSFLIPKPPTSVILQLNNYLPEWVGHIFHFRFLISSVALMAFMHLGTKSNKFNN